MDAGQKLKSRVKEEFAEYLEEHKCRKTSERFAILDQIYSTSGHFSMITLYDSMQENNFRVSRATLYNTMELLLDCGLVVKHQFGNGRAVYERKYGKDSHHHLICSSCGRVWELKNEWVYAPVQLKKSRKFTVSYYSMYIYGICSKCAHAKRMRLRRLARKKRK